MLTTTYTHCGAVHDLLWFGCNSSMGSMELDGLLAQAGSCDFGKCFLLESSSALLWLEEMKARRSFQFV